MLNTTGLGRHRAAAIALLVAGSIALAGAQQILGSVAEAETTHAVADSYSLQRLPETKSLEKAMVSAAVSSGQFEDLVKPTPTPRPTVAPTPAPAPEAPTPEPPPVYESGVASTYGEGDGFEGNRTACGQIFHTRVAQVAHKTLACGTTVRIEDVSTGRTVEAVVTDRGPYIPGRIVDLSWGAFEQLDPTGPGLLPVNIYVLDD